MYIDPEELEDVFESATKMAQRQQRTVIFVDRDGDAVIVAPYAVTRNGIPLPAYVIEYPGMLGHGYTFPVVQSMAGEDIVTISYEAKGMRLWDYCLDREESISSPKEAYAYAQANYGKSSFDDPVIYKL